MSTTSHVDILGSELPDLSEIEGLEYIGGHIDYQFEDSALVAFDQYAKGVWTAALWPLRGEGHAEALALAAAFRAQGTYAWAYIEDAQVPLDPAFGPRRPRQS